MARSTEEFVYRGRSAEDVDAQANQSNSNFDKIIKDRFPTMKVEKGDHTFRALPPTFAKSKADLKKYGKHWGLKIFVHRNVGPKDQMYLCLDAMKGEECPICEFAKQLEREGESEDAYQLRQQFLYLAWAIDRDDESAGPQVWMVPMTLDRDIGLLSKDRRTKELLLVDHPEEGYDIDFRREGKGLGTKYTGVRIARDQTPILEGKPKTQAKWLAFITENSLLDVLNFYDPEYLEKQVNATAPDKDDEDKPSKKKKKAAEEDEDEEDEAPKKVKRVKATVDEDEDEEDEPKPKKKKPAADEEDEDEEAPPPKKKKAVVEEDEDEEDEPKSKKKKAPVEDEDDEDETPSKSAKAALRAGKKKPAADEDDDEEEDPKPKKKKAPVEEDEDEEDEPAPKKKKKPVVEEDEDEEDEPAPKLKKKKAPVEDEDENDD